jgi:hypothetical protein
LGAATYGKYNMKILLALLSSILVFAKVQFEGIFRLAGNEPSEPESDLYRPQCGHYFNIEGMHPSEVTFICDMLFMLGVNGFGLGYPSDKHIANAKTLWLFNDEHQGLLIYFFREDQKFITPVNPPQSVDDLQAAAFANDDPIEYVQVDDIDHQLSIDQWKEADKEIESLVDHVREVIRDHEGSSAFSNGEQAFGLGMSINENPYIEKFFDHESADQWLCGYLSARDKQLSVSPVLTAKADNCNDFVADKMIVKDALGNIAFYVDQGGFIFHNGDER